MIKIIREELSKVIQENIKKMLKEDWYHEDYTDRGAEDQHHYGQSENEYEDEPENGNPGEKFENSNETLMSYLETLIWPSGEEYDEYSVSDFDTNSIEKSINDIDKFVQLIGQNEQAIEEMNTYDEKSFGHNFALSRNGHDAGFFDDNNDILQDLARNFGQAKIYASDNGGLSILGSENGITENKNVTKLKLTRQELSEMVQRSVQKVMNENKSEVLEIKKPTIKVKLSELRQLIKMVVEEHDSTDKAIADYDDEQSNKYTKNYDDEEGGAITEEEKPSAGLSKGEKSGIAKKARAGKDIGKPGKNFDKVADKAAKEYGSKEAGERVAAASMWKNANK